MNLHSKTEGIWNTSKSSSYIEDRLGESLLKRHRRDLHRPIQLSNLGATCYLNVLMQSLYHNIFIRNAIYNMDTSLLSSSASDSSPLNVEKTHKRAQESRGIQVLRNLQEVFGFMDRSEDSLYELNSFTSSIGIDLGEQQDPHEFNKLFLDKIESLSSSSSSSSSSESSSSQPRGIKSLIQGRLRNCIQCLHCNHESVNVEEFMELGLNIESTAPTSVEERLVAYFKDEFLLQENQNGYLCSKCESKQNAKRTIELIETPTVLFLQLLRYVFDKQSCEKKKRMVILSLLKVIFFTVNLLSN